MTNAWLAALFGLFGAPRCTESQKESPQLTSGHDANFYRRQYCCGWWDQPTNSLAVQSRSVVESAMLMLHCGRPYGTDSSRQRQDHARRPSCDTAIEGFDPRARQPL